MSEHAAAVPDRARRLIRTIVTVATSVAAVLLVLVPIVLQALQPLSEQLPGGWYPWLVGVAGTIIAVALAVQRILTSDVVEQLLQRYAPRFAAVTPDGAAVITSLPPVVDDAAAIAALPAERAISADTRASLSELRDFLDEGDPARDALTTVLNL